MLQLDSIAKEYAAPSGALRILDGITLAIERGTSVSIVGPSGSGKSTLLAILGALDAPTSGRVTLDGQDPFALDEAEQAAFRNRKIGFVFQDHCLLPQCTVLENVLIPALAGAGEEGAEPRARHLLDRVGLGPRLDHLPGELSGGEKQRVAIARALIGKPTLVLCDEPTGNLDRATADSVSSLLWELHREDNTILVVVTHSDRLAARAARCYELAGGRLQSRSN